MKFSDFSNEKYRLNSFSVRIKYQPTVPNFLDSSLNLKKLWENESPTSSFPTQTISLDLSKYDYIIIIFKIGSTSNEYVTNLLLKNYMTLTSCVYVDGGQTYSSVRYCTCKDTGIDITDAVSGKVTTTITVNNNTMIPLAIYGK